MIQEKMKASQSRQKSYHDKRRKDIEFQVGDHVFLRVNPVTGVGRALKCRKLTPHFVGPFNVIEKVGDVAYRIALPPSLSNLHNVFHVSQLRKYVHDLSHGIQVDDVEVRDNLTVETWPVRIECRDWKRLRGKEIVLVKVIWVGQPGESATWEAESRMKVSYPELFPSGVQNRNIFCKPVKVHLEVHLSDLIMMMYYLHPMVLTAYLSVWMGRRCAGVVLGEFVLGDIGSFLRYRC
ncbi:Pol polyprotein/retrotransposon, putative [Medicago truncatula]|uniref:Pol polyprotein/retrotransposon, putative n=1 Tax=Medicago truncatula TaxID=3880 RepID=A0A072TJZ0_MEDTR|nr:Pol polyprotein/retrotransposon, putative [Medicago truncatula]